jgi:putative ABC transport system permease protein
VNDASLCHSQWPSWTKLQEWPTAIPTWIVARGITATLIIGGVVGLYPAIRAARVASAEALAAT